MTLRILNVGIDVNDLDRMRSFWEAVTGYRVHSGDDSYVYLVDRDERGPNLFVQKVPERRTEKNRLHLDLVAPNLSAATAEVVALGAVPVRTVEAEGEIWTIFEDPEGNQFCVVQA